jgi:hypothetical protein
MPHFTDLFALGDLRHRCQRYPERVRLRQVHRQAEQDHHHQRQGELIIH